MNINFKSTTPKKSSYQKNDKLKAFAFYEDDDGGLVVTRASGKPVVVFFCGEAYPPSSIAWPIKDTDITLVTISL